MPWAELTDVRMYYELFGSGDPVLLIPGLGANCRLWDGVLPSLAEQFSVICEDNRGAGRPISKRPLKSLQDLSSDLVELLDTLQLDRAHVVGLSMGGIIAQRLALDHPTRVSRLVLMSCAHQFGPYLRQITTLLGHTLRRFPYRLFLETMELLGTAPAHFDAAAEQIEAGIDSRCAEKVGKDAVIAQLRAIAAASFDTEDYQIRCPTLVLAGEYDALIPNCYAKQMADAIPGSRFVVLKGCGHNPVAEQPQAVLDVVIPFLNEDLGPSSGVDFASECVSAI